MPQHPEQIEIFPRPTTLTSFDRAMAQARHLNELGRAILQPHERPDHGKIHYTTITEAINEWSRDPHGSRKFEFMANAYGIPHERLREILQEVGLGEYVRVKSEGRLVGQVSTQILKPTYYFMANALILGYLTRHYGIPSALMVSTYETDTFSYNNSDKTDALGIIDFPVGVEQESGRIQTVKIKLVPVGVRQQDGNVRPVDFNGLGGQRCCDIMVRVATAFDGKNNIYTQLAADVAKSYIQAALGININQGEISLTDFYKQMWITAINRLRESGDLPSEREMPMFFVSGEQVYSSLPRVANPPDKTREILGGIHHTVNRNLRQLSTGIVVKADTGVMDPAWYYPMEYGLPDLYFECSSCGGDYFVEKLARGDRLLEVYDLPTSEVRLPDREIPELESFIIHPSEGYVDMKSAQAEIEKAIAPIAVAIESLKEDIAEGKVGKSPGRHRLQFLLSMLHKVREDLPNRMLIRSVINDPFIPEIVAATYKELLGDFDAYKV